MKHSQTLFLSALALIAISPLVLVACGEGNAAPSTSATEPAAKEVRVAYFPNITHVQPLVGLARGTFQEAMGPTAIQTKVFNAGPSEIEALFAGAIDIGYIGQSPAVNGYVQSKGEALRVIAGAVSGGASLVVRPDSGINGPQDLAGKRIASPQLGNTQDVSLRHYLQANGLETKERGGSVQVLPISNPDILSLSQRKEIAGAWVPEPWATRLVVEAGGRRLIDERDLWPQGRFAATIVIVRKKFLDEQPDLVRRWLKAHVEVTRWVTDHPQEAQDIVQREFLRLTGAGLSPQVIGPSFAHMEVLYDPMRQAITTAAISAYDLGFLGSSKPNLDLLVELRPLNDVLRQLGLSEVR